MPVTIETIRDAARLIEGAVMRTPCLPAPKLSQLTGAEIFVKYENLQVTNAFKERGALVKLASLSDAERARGVIAMSHARSSTRGEKAFLGVAFVASNFSQGLPFVATTRTVPFPLLSTPTRARVGRLGRAMRVAVAKELAAREIEAVAEVGAIVELLQRQAVPADAIGRVIVRAASTLAARLAVCGRHIVL